jgi:septal ring factor EnvC (AmiA/AmiB activator)
VNTIKYFLYAVAFAGLYINSNLLYAATAAATSSMALANAESKLSEIDVLRNTQMPVLQNILNKQQELEKEKQKRYETDKKINQAITELNKLTAQLKEAEKKTFTAKVKAAFINYETRVKALKPQN